ncbi:hypothetical protein CHRYSEOSP005_05170 [Chryseobacterium sp. Alg-005]|uniref:class I SAM-dependent methyltransferase n=1 Tax=Chryseobacterium sp. Alg-005 TaxID=3159516 RepID=UPI003555B617
MYNFLKTVAKNLIPEKVLINNEEKFRKLLVPFYRGNNNGCNICGTQLKGFAELPNGEKICPVCGSIPRIRRLYKLLETEFLKPDMSFLDFSPFRVLYKKLKADKNIQYFSSDYEDDFLADYHFDIRNINVEDNTFDLITCYHILEHIIEDTEAMKELHRVLKPGGTLLVQTPFKEGEIYEDYTITTPEDRLKYFGQDNHVRIYSVSGLENRLKEAGLQTEVRTFAADDFYGLSANEKIIICRK